MTLIKHELRRGRTALLVWTAGIGALLALCVLIYPEMAGEMDAMGDMFSSMGAFSEAFGMDRLNFGTLMGFYGIECGNVLGLGGAFFTALTAVSALSKEEKDGTAEYLMTHPVSRAYVVTGKLLSVLAQVVLLNAAIFLVALLSITAIGEEIPWKELSLIHLANLLMQLQLAGVCFGISAFLRHGSVGIGLGAALGAYFLNIIANITEDAEFLKYFTPYSYTQSADILSSGTLDFSLIAPGIAFFAAGILTAYLVYCRKDI